jgi:stage II sporulation protein D
LAQSDDDSGGQENWEHPREMQPPSLKEPDSAVRSRDDERRPGRFSNMAPNCRIRVELGQNMKQAIFSFSGHMEIRSGAPEHVTAQGSVSCEAGASPCRILLAFSGKGTQNCSLPCTLWSNSEFNIVQYGGKSYRGSMILACEQRGSFSVINSCDVEDYLRGVVPLEIGNCSKEEIEAMKAQAVAARTYTYKKIQNCANQAYDLHPSISDQVYGGVNAEKTLCNQAIRDTRDLVAVYPASVSGGEDSLIFAYYHSTCGGKTSNIEDMWEKTAFPYLRSIDDRDENGRPFCAGSLSFSWEESWPIERLSKIINQFSRETFPQNPSSGTLKNITVTARSSCGRTRACSIITTNGTFTYGGDKIRFILRRNLAGFPLLRSACITDIAKSGGAIVIRGRGFGHGIGMCQFGAIGRARAGQSFEQIIKAYYTGVEIRKIEREK